LERRQELCFQVPAIRRQPYAWRAVFILCSTSIGLRNAHVNNVTQFLGFALDASQQVLKQSHACTRWLPAGKQQVGMVSSASPARCRLRLGIHRMPQKKKKRGEKKLLRGARCAHSAAAPPALHGTCTAPCARRVGPWRAAPATLQPLRAPAVSLRAPAVPHSVSWCVPRRWLSALHQQPSRGSACMQHGNSVAGALAHIGLSRWLTAKRKRPPKALAEANSTPRCIDEFGNSLSAKAEMSVKVALRRRSTVYGLFCAAAGSF